MGYEGVRDLGNTGGKDICNGCQTESRTFTLCYGLHADIWGIPVIEPARPAWRSRVVWSAPECKYIEAA